MDPVLEGRPLPPRPQQMPRPEMHPAHRPARHTPPSARQLRCWGRVLSGCQLPMMLAIGPNRPVSAMALTGSVWVCVVGFPAVRVQV